MACLQEFVIAERFDDLQNTYIALGQLPPYVFQRSLGCVQNDLGIQSRGFIPSEARRGQDELLPAPAGLYPVRDGMRPPASHGKDIPDGPIVNGDKGARLGAGSIQFRLKSIPGGADLMQQLGSVSRHRHGSWPGDVANDGQGLHNIAVPGV